MITEEQRIKMKELNNDQVKKECEDIIKAASVYERASSNTDFLEIVEHWKGLVKIHKGQIEGWMSQMAGASFFKRLKMMDVALIHQIRKEQLEEWINYPARIIEQAKQAREILRELREKEKNHVSRSAS